MVTDDVGENFNWISWGKKKNTIGLRRSNDFESGPKICMHFQPQFYDNHICHYFVHFNPSLDVYESLFLTLASQSEFQEWKKGRFKHETGPWYPVAFFRQNHSTFPHALDTSLNLVELCLFYIFHTLGTSISCLCCYCFFLCQIKMSFIRYFLLLVIVLTRAAPALQYHFLFFFLSWACCLQLCNFSVMLLWNCAQYFGFNNFGSQNTTSVQNVVLGSAWDVFFLLCGLT